MYSNHLFIAAYVGRFCWKVLEIPKVGLVWSCADGPGTEPSSIACEAGLIDDVISGNLKQFATLGIIFSMIVDQN